MEKLGFYVANLDQDCTILGYPWFKRFNPSFVWDSNSLLEDIDMARYYTKATTTLRAVELKPEEVEDRKSIQSQIPKAYHKYWEVFSEQASYHFPPAHKEDHTITLKKGIPDKIDCKIY